MTKQYKIRSTFIFFIFCFLDAVIALTLYLIQVRQHDFFVQLGEKQYSITITQAPPRAAIFDRSGKNCLALNKDCVSAFILPKKIENQKALKKFLKKHFPQALERLTTTHSDKYFMYVKRRLNDEHIALIKESGITDIYLLNEPSRFYPIECAGPVIGITDIDNNGLFGIEMQYNERLAGSPTTFRLEKDARSGHFYFDKETKIQGQEGTPITLTIDSDMQFLTYESLKETVSAFDAKEAAAIIMNPHTGEILAMTTFPDFDPNQPDQLDLATTKNKIVTEVYELGSVIKTCAALAALEEGVVTPDEMIDCENRLTTYIDGRRINTTPTTETGIVPFSMVIKKSNNIGVAKVAKRLGTKLYDHYRRLGFGMTTNIAFPGERSGYVNPPEKWSKQSIFSLSYGYEISGTLLQLAKVFSIIANGGYDIMPILVVDQQQPHERKRLYSEKTIQEMKQILEVAPTAATKKEIGLTGYRLMRKTGTANTIIDGTYAHNKNLFTCAGIVEKGSYSRVMVVFVKEVPKKGLVLAAHVAAPLLEKLAKKLLIHDKVL